MKNLIKISDFAFKVRALGIYSVTYTCPVTGIVYLTITDDISLIDLTAFSNKPKTKDLNTLKRICKF